MITKFEAFGIASCIGIMVLALFLMRLDGTTESLATVDKTNNSVASVVVAADTEDKHQARANAIVSSIDQTGEQKSLVIDDITFGNGAEATEGDVVRVHYIGRLENGQEFDNSYKRGEPIEFTLGKGEVIAGWEEGIEGMKVGGERILVVPPEYAYGNRSVGPIPAGAKLIFAVELISVESE